MRTRNLFCAIVAFFSFLTFVCSKTAHTQVPRDIKWVTTSIEYAAMCVQTYRHAWQAVQKASSSETDNWVVVLDVDETVLDNSTYQSERATIDSAFTPHSWTAWVLRKEATVVPGAKAFIDSVRSLGPRAHIAFLTNRDWEHEAATIDNLRRFDLFKDRDIMLTRRDRNDTKVLRRQCLETGTERCKNYGPLRIVALVGDNIRDFMPMRGEENARNYRLHEVFSDPNWGVTYFMLPNPMYGSWERDYQ